MTPRPAPAIPRQRRAPISPSPAAYRRSSRNWSAKGARRRVAGPIFSRPVRATHEAAAHGDREMVDWLQRIVVTISGGVISQVPPNTGENNHLFEMPPAEQTGRIRVAIPHQISPTAFATEPISRVFALAAIGIWHSKAIDISDRFAHGAGRGSPRPAGKSRSPRDAAVAPYRCPVLNRLNQRPLHVLIRRRHERHGRPCGGSHGDPLIVAVRETAFEVWLEAERPRAYVP